MFILNAEWSCSSQLTRVPSEFGIFGYLLRIPLPTVTSDTCIQSLQQDYNCGAHLLPLFPLCPVGLAGLVRAVVAATGVLADTTGATGAALTTGATGTALLTAGATGAALTAAALVATVGTAGTALDSTEEMTGTAEVRADTVGTIAGVEATAEVPAAAVFGCSVPTVPTGGGACDEATPVETPVTSQASGTT